MMWKVFVSHTPSWEVFVSHTPSWMLFSEGRLKYIWYFCSDIQFTNGTQKTLIALNSKKYEKYGIKMNLLRLNVSAAISQCTDESSSISVYAGLLTWYLMKWRASPLSTVTCNTRQPVDTSIVPHWYATVLLDTSSSVPYVDVTITLDTVQTYLTRNITFTTLSSQLSYTSHASGFDVIGPQYTVPHHHISVSKSSSLVTFREAGMPFP